LAKLPEKKVKLPKAFLKALQEALREGRKPPKGYKYLHYRVALFLNQNFQVVDARIVATKNTRLKFIERAKKQNLFILITPNPVKIPQEFWKKYKLTQTAKGRIALIKEYKLLNDENTFIVELLLDIDSPYKEVKKAVKDLLRDLGIEKDPFQVKLMQTGSGNARLIIPLEVNFLIGNTENGDNGDAVFNPTKKHFNGHTHLQNLKEVLAIISAYLQRKGLNVDLTSVDRINHQVWDPSAHPKKGKYEIKEVVPTLRKITPYNLYRRVKKLQKEHQLYTLKRGNKEINLTTYFGWRPEYKPSQRAKVIRVPKFIVERLKDRAIVSLEEDIKLHYWKKAVKSLAEKHSSYRFTYVILPAVGWALYLGLDRYEVESYLKEVLSDRDSRKTEKDIDTAFRVANELEFNLPKRVRSLNFETLLRSVLEHLLKGGEVSRQELVELLGNQKWLTDLIMNALVKVGLVEAEFIKAGRGRPRKVFRLTEKGKQVAQGLTPKVVSEVWRVAIGQDFSAKEFSPNNNSPKASLKVEVGSLASSSGENKQGLRNLTKMEEESAHKAGCVAQMGIAKKGAPEREEEKKDPQREGKKEEPPRRKEEKPPTKGGTKRKAEELLNRLRKGRRKRGGTESIGDILGLDPPL